MSFTNNDENKKIIEYCGIKINFYFFVYYDSATSHFSCNFSNDDSYFGFLINNSRFTGDVSRRKKERKRKLNY